MHGTAALAGRSGTESFISKSPRVFLGLPNAAKAFNVQISKDLHLNGVVGQVFAMTVGNGMLFAGTSDGTRLTNSLVEVDKGLRISKVEIREAESLGYKIVGDALNGRDRELWLSGEERGRGGVDAEKRVVAR
ncbi:hypothetical protein DY000_02057024 [Brassica cretica]|uniref:Uncharacterized protein n=1 Tax=Brassica cretica TaxID=69181 RepID=A0ABQ7AD44_BRACR|nr:hypothetical protein DY000_02057024 [Brassica cretica]